MMREVRTRENFSAGIKWKSDAAHGCFRPNRPTHKIQYVAERPDGSGRQARNGRPSTVSRSLMDPKSDTLNWLYSLEGRGEIYKLERMDQALALLGNPHLKLRAV